MASKWVITYNLVTNRGHIEVMTHWSTPLILTSSRIHLWSLRGSTWKWGSQEKELEVYFHLSFRGGRYLNLATILLQLMDFFLEGDWKCRQVGWKEVPTKKKNLWSGQQDLPLVVFARSADWLHCSWIETAWRSNVKNPVILGERFGARDDNSFLLQPWLNQLVGVEHLNFVVRIAP